MTNHELLIAHLSAMKPDRMAEEIIRVMNGEYRYDACPAGHFCHNMELAARDIGCDWESSPPCKQILTAWLCSEAKQ